MCVWSSDISTVVNILCKIPTKILFTYEDMQLQYSINAFILNSCCAGRDFTLCRALSTISKFVDF